MIKKSMVFIAVLFGSSWVMIEASSRSRISITEPTPIFKKLDKVKSEFSALHGNVKNLVKSVMTLDVDSTDYYNVSSYVKYMANAFRILNDQLINFSFNLDSLKEKENEERLHRLDEQEALGRENRQLKADVEAKIQSLPE
jgi:hypothetical protein